MVVAQRRVKIILLRICGKKEGALGKPLFNLDEMVFVKVRSIFIIADYLSFVKY